MILAMAFWIICWWLLACCWTKGVMMLLHNKANLKKSVLGPMGTNWYRYLYSGMTLRRRSFVAIFGKVPAAT